MNFKKINYRFPILLAILLIIASNALLTTNKDKIKYYKERYKVKCASEKITDNFGNGNESLYGTRNMRTILYGVAYRGGANNYYHKKSKRDNKNPIPKDGLANLAAEGFSKVVYLYATNYATADKYYVNPENKDTLFYLQNSLSDRKKIKEVMLLILDVIKNPNKGPVYLHCWNGWHQSGFISAAILMQFCNYSNEEALQYWIKNTDGVTKGYDHIQKMIREFKRFDDINIDESIKKEICPCLD